MKEGTQKYRVAKALADRDDEPTATDLKTELDMPDGSVLSALQNLRKDGYVERDGEGGQSDPYRHRLTSKGEAAVDVNGTDVDESTAGLNQLFPEGDDGEEVANDGGGAKADEPTSGAPTLGDDVVDVTYSIEEAVDILLALGDADEPDFDTRRSFARSIVRNLRKQG